MQVERPEPGPFNSPFTAAPGPGLQVVKETVSRTFLSFHRLYYGARARLTQSPRRFSRTSASSRSAELYPAQVPFTGSFGLSGLCKPAAEGLLGLV